MKAQYLTRGLAVVLAGQLFATSALAGYGNIYIPRHTVVPVVFDDELSMRENREGDRFYVHVDNDRELPRGTRMEGRILDIQRKDGKRPAYMDLEFTSVVFPDGSRESIRAVPIKLDSKAITRSRDGRLQADQSKLRSEHLVLGGLIGGLIIGSLIKKPFEGAFVGTLAGVILGEAQRSSNGDVIVRRGAKMGAMFEEDADIRYGYGRDRDDDWTRDQDRDREDDWNRDRNNDDWNRDRDRNDDWDRDRDQRDRDRDQDYGRDRQARITYEGRELRFDRDAQPFREGNEWMVPLQKSAGQLGLTVEGARDSQTLFIEDDDSSLRLELDSRNYRLNGKRGTMPTAVVNRDDVIYVPLRILAATKDRPVYLNGTKLGQNAYN